MNRSIRLPALMLALSLLGLVVSSSTVRAQDKDAPYEKGVTIEGITEYRLKNGCKFLLFPDPASSKVTVNMTVLVGSRHEGYGETGMAHLLEHMLFKGSSNFPHIDKEMQKHGADYNGTTWTDRTNYYEPMPATDENLEFGIKLEADRLINSFIRREDLLKEMTVVRNEFEMGENNPEYILSQRMAAVAYEWHNYGKSTIGNRSDIERVPIESLQEFYKKFYQPDNIVVIVAGKFDERKAIKLHAEAIRQPGAPAAGAAARTYTEEPAQDGERVVILRRVGKVAATGAVYHVPAAAHPDHPVIEVLSSILGDHPSGRLYKGLVEKKLATDDSASAFAWRDPGLLEVGATVAEKVAPEKVRDAMLEIVEGFAGRAPADQRGSRSRQAANYQSSIDQAMTQSQKIALRLSEWAGAGDWRLMFLYRDRVAKVTPEDVSRVAIKYLTQTNRTVGIFFPTEKIVRATIPEAPDVAELVKDYKGGKALAAGEDFDTSPENIDKRTKRFTLASGIKVALLPKKTRGEAVVGQVVLRFGNEKSLVEFKDATDYLGQHADARHQESHAGANQRRSQQAGVQAARQQRPGTALVFQFRASAASCRRCSTSCARCCASRRSPRRNSTIIKDTAKQSLREAMADPQSLASNALRRQLNPYPKDHIRYVPTYAESIAERGSTS